MTVVRECVALQILAERVHQVEGLCYTPEHDDACDRYTLIRKARTHLDYDYSLNRASIRRHNLVQVGALVMAAIEYIDRAEVRVAKARKASNPGVASDASDE